MLSNTEAKWIQEIRDNTKQLKRIAEKLDTIAMLIAVKVETDTPQMDCSTCAYGTDKHRYAHICNECGVGINNYKEKQ